MHWCGPHIASCSEAAAPNSLNRTVQCFMAVALQVDGRGALAVTGAAALANLFESWLGATAQGKVEWLSNDLVNVLQISLAAALAVAFVVWAP